MSDGSISAPLDTKLLDPHRRLGNGTCPELSRVSHCRNCEVYSASGRRLLDRPAPADYIESWTELLAEEKVAAQAATVPHLRVPRRPGLARLPCDQPSRDHRAEGRSERSPPPREFLLGLVNVRGELHPCVSLHDVFGEEAPAPSPADRSLSGGAAGGRGLGVSRRSSGRHARCQPNSKSSRCLQRSQTLTWSYTQGPVPFRRQDGGDHRRGPAVWLPAAEDLQ